MPRTKRPPLKCPEGYRPGCTCSCTALEPREDCYVHGWPDQRQCPYCGQMRGAKPCRRCGCDYFFHHATGEPQ